MVVWVKTTIEIPDAVLVEAKRLAAARGVTLKSVLEEALRQLLAAEHKPKKPFKLRDGSFGHNGLQPGLRWGDWETVRTLIYEGRGA